jgi:hypothetical protein
MYNGWYRSGSITHLNVTAMNKNGVWLEIMKSLCSKIQFDSSVEQMTAQGTQML